MDNRHNVSAPRPVGYGPDGNMPSWEVDILRDDTVIVDTFLLNSAVLPPRTKKKGKVVWKLPDDAETLPSFGTDDRRRILDIFKERKKKRKQEKKKRNLSPSQNGDDDNGKYERRDSTTTSPGLKGSGASVKGTYVRHDSDSSGGGFSGGGTTAKMKGKENGHSSENLLKEPEGEDHPPNGKSKERKQSKKIVQVERGRGTTRESASGLKHSQPSLNPMPPGLVSSQKRASPETSRLPALVRHQSESNSSTLPTTGLQQNQSSSAQPHPQVPTTPDPSRLSLHDPEQDPAPPQPQPNNGRPKLSPQTSFIDPPAPDALFIVVPRIERPETPPGQPQSSLAVPAARHFISRYYSHFDGAIPGAQIGDLIRYYTTKAQKSVSIGGAHSVVTGRRDIAAQILNFAGAAFIVRGVVAQDTADGKGVHILVTGTARTSLNGSAAGVLASFAHSISLVPIEEDAISREMYINCPALRDALEIGFPFQIHNDALALLNDAGPVTPQPIQLQQPPMPPPGLF